MTNSVSQGTRSSGWHEGEIALQRRVGSYEKMAVVGPKVLRPYMLDQHREFFAELPFVVLGSLDGEGRPWATVRCGAPGFILSPDDTHLKICVGAEAGDPASLEVGAAVGLLGIQPHTRRRNRANGTVEGRSTSGLTIHVTQSFGNCPRFITRREALFEPAGAPPPEAERFEFLDPDACAMIEAADTFFVASYVRRDDGSADVDVSHRGGEPGFVGIDRVGTLVVPDYAGNNFFNTLGNFVCHPVCGLLFIDYERGDLLQITGRVSLHLDEASEHAARHWRVAPQLMVRRRGALPLRWRS